MPNLHYRFTGDADQLPVTPAAQLNLDENSDDWWAGLTWSFVAIPVAGTLVAVALSASLAWGYQQQTEDIVPQPPGAAVVALDAGAWTVQRVPDSQQFVIVW